MVGRFQFSLRQLFVTVTLLCIAVWLIHRIYKANLGDVTANLGDVTIWPEMFGAAIVIAAIVGGVIGAWLREPTLCAIVFVMLAAIGMIVFLVFYGIPAAFSFGPPG